MDTEVHAVGPIWFWNCELELCVPIMACNAWNLEQACKAPNAFVCACHGMCCLWTWTSDFPEFLYAILLSVSIRGQVELEILCCLLTWNCHTHAYNSIHSRVTLHSISLFKFSYNCKDRGLPNWLVPDYHSLLTIQPKATPRQTAAITTDSDFNLCICTFRSHNPSTALSTFSLSASSSCFISKMRSSQQPPRSPKLGGIDFFQWAGSSPGLRK